ncbi:hypothetical protein ACJJTC_016489 [Scirpophaga incertulas]
MERMRCANCTISTVRLRRHSLSESENEEVLTILRRWYPMRRVQSDSHICHPCWMRASEHQYSAPSTSQAQVFVSEPDENENFLSSPATEERSTHNTPPDSPQQLNTINLPNYVRAVVTENRVNVEKYLDQNEVYNQKRGDGSDRNIEPIAGPSGLNAPRKRDRGTSADTDDSIPARRRLNFTKPRGRPTGARGGCNSFVRRNRTEENESIAETPFRATSSPYEETTQAEEDGRGDIPESGDERGGEESDDDPMGCTMGKRKYNNAGHKLSPWKVIAKHRGTKRTHYHIIYISTAKNWGHNSKLGKTIRAAEYKCSQIACIQCLLEYITTGDDRTTFREILTDSDKRIAMCVAHSLGLDPQRETSNNTRSTERGNNVLRLESTTRGTGHTGNRESSVSSDQNIFQFRENARISECESEQHDVGNQPNALCRGPGFKSAPRNAEIIRENQRLVMYLCENQAFDKGKATLLLSSTIEGCNAYFNRYFRERLTHALCIAKALVFQESTKQRFERAKQYQLKTNPHAADPDIIHEGVRKLEALLMKNDINVYSFSYKTYAHLHRQLGKQNNLFFYGPPGGGKTTIMESLVECHFNYTCLTGLTPTSPFNFSSLIYRNACFMDECKLTDNHFEQWKQLAGGQKMNTDIKYEDRQEVTDCVLYTASNYPINAYLTVPESMEAIAQRTVQFNFYVACEYFYLNAFIWEEFWKQYRYLPVDDDEILVEIN